MNPILMAQIASGATVASPPATPVTPPPGGGTPAVGVSVAWSDPVVDVAGVNVHTHQATNWIYRQGPNSTSGIDAMVTAFNYCRIRHVRDDYGLNSAVERAALKALGQAGVKSLLMLGTYWSGQTPPSTGAALADIQANYPDCEAVEGVNESDLSGRADWVAITKAYQQQIWNTFNPAGYTVLSPSVGHAGSQSWYNTLGSVDANADVCAIHQYTGGLQPSHAISQVIGWSSANVSPGKPRWFTEGGDHDAIHAVNGFPPVTEAVSAIYAPILILEAYRQGLKRYYRYELGDDRADNAYTNRELHFGLFAWNAKIGVAQTTPAWRAKPNATAIRNLLGILADPGPTFTPANLDVTITGGDASLRYLILGKRDGSYVIPIWRDVAVWAPSTTVQDGGRVLTVTPQTITVTFGVSRVVSQYKPSTSESAVSTTTGLQAAISVSGELSVLWLQAQTPGGVPGGQSLPFAPDAVKTLPWAVDFNDDFTGTTLDASKWSDHEPYQAAPGFKGDDGWHPVPATNAVVTGGLLTMQVRRTAGLPQSAVSTAVDLNTRGKYATPALTTGHGMFLECRCSIPSGKGLWPALWTEGYNDLHVGSDSHTGWPTLGENDIFEFFNNSNSDGIGYPFWSLHYPADVYTSPPGTWLNDTHVYQSTSTQRLDLCDSFHTWGLYVQPTQAQVYIDGVLQWTYQAGQTYSGNAVAVPPVVFTNPQFLRLSHNVGGYAGQGWAQSDWADGDFIVDYVKVWKF